MSQITLRGGFITHWSFERIVRFNLIDYRLWSCMHREGYTAYQFTHDDNHPTGSGHYTRLPDWAVKK